MLKTHEATLPLLYTHPCPHTDPGPKRSTDKTRAGFQSDQQYRKTTSITTLQRKKNKEDKRKTERTGTVIYTTDSPVTDSDPQEH